MDDPRRHRFLARRLPASGLALALLLCPACRKGGGARFQSAPIAASASAIAPFVGRWYDDQGHLGAVVSGGENPKLTIVLPDDVELVSSFVAGDRIVLPSISYGAPVELTLLPVGSEVFVLVRRGEAPICGCVRCANAFIRRSAADIAKERVEQGWAHVSRVPSRLMDGAAAIF